MTNQEIKEHIIEIAATGLIPQAIATEALAHIANGDLARSYFLIKPYLFQN